jgi:hypothetical protein
MCDPDAEENAAIAAPSVNLQTFSPLCSDMPVEYRSSKVGAWKVGLSVTSQAY